MRTSVLPSTLAGLDLSALSASERAQLSMLCAKAQANALAHGWHEEAAIYGNDLRMLQALEHSQRMGRLS